MTAHDRLESNSILTYLKLTGLTHEVELEPSPRLNLLIGDNGVGKTFLLDCIWWTLTNTWASGLPAYPASGQHNPQITFQLADTDGFEPIIADYDRAKQQWKRSERDTLLSGLCVYARVDGSFAVFDPAWGKSRSQTRTFNRDEIWEGKTSTQAKRLRTEINGLIQDLVLWQYQTEKSPIRIFEAVLQLLAEGTEFSPLRLGTPKRWSLDDSRETPVLLMPYGEVPIIYAAAGIRRIMTLAYLITWTWYEHIQRSKLLDQNPQRRMVIIVDEIEAHLHPKWQRLILPALLKVDEALGAGLDIQFFVATHSPFVPASVEGHFQHDQDKLFHLNLENQRVTLEERPFEIHGSINNWLTSDIFELKFARSIEAEQAILDAKQLQQQAKPNPQDVQEVTHRLKQFLAVQDEFWPRWVYFAEQNGATL